MKNHLLNLIFLTSFLISQPPDSWCEILPTNTSGVFQGIATTAGVPAESGDWVGAVDSDGNCAGAGELIIDNGTAYMNLTIYGDDLLSGDVDEGINSGESFTLMLWDNSAEQTLTLSEQFDCWTNNSGAPMDGCGGLSNTYDFQLPAPGPQFSSSLTIGGDGSSYDLTFGFHPDATDGYDDSFDFYAPPAPPPPAFDAALMWGGERYYTQILNGSSSDLTEHVYEISMVYGSDNVITVTWSNEGYAESMSSAIIQDAFGGAFINVNMTDGSGTVNPAFGSLDVSDPANPIITLINTAVTTLKLLVTPTAPVDDPPLVSGIPDQEVESPLAFSSFDLDDYLTELDGDVVSWSYEITAPPEPGFAETITASSSDGTYDMTFGFHPDATDGYDENTDYYAPPAPPPPAFDAALQWNGERYYTQILAFDGDNSEHEYDITVQYGSDNQVTLAWDNTGWSDLMSSCMLQDAFGGIMINVDMLSQSSFTNTNTAFTLFKLKVTPLPEAMQARNIMVDIDEDNVATLSYSSGWTGSEVIVFTATDQTAEGLSGSDNATFTVSPGVDEAPVVGDIPDQSVDEGQSFSSFDLDDYLTELDGDDVAWSYEITAPPEPGFFETITATAGESSYGMTFGFHPDATDGYDEDTDYYAPPAPPPPAFDAALQWNGERYYTQILAFDGDNSEHEYDVTVQYGSDNQVTLSWDNTGWSDLMSSCLLQDAFGGVMINVDMLSQSSFTNTNTAFTLFKLKVTPLPGAMQTRDIMVDIDEDNVATVSYNAGWTGSEVVTFTATDQTAEGLSGSDQATFTVLDMDFAPQVGGIPDQTTNPGSEFESFDLDDYLTELDGDAVEWSYDIPGQAPEPGFAEIITASSEGGTYDMTFGFHPDATDGYDENTDYYAPPAPPPPAFDAALQWNGERYYTQILAFDGDNSEHEYDITVQYGSDNQVTLAWDNTGWSDLMSSCMLQDAFGGVMINVDMLSQSSFTNTNTAFTLFKLKVTPLPEAVQTRLVMVDIDENNVATVSYETGWTGSEEIVFTATDQTEAGLSGSDAAVFTVLDNSAPVADDQSVTLNEDESLAITLTAADGEGDPLSYSVLSGPSNGSLSGDAPELTYTPNENYNGSDSFTFQVSDGSMTDDGT
ncbi:MAG: hypothetical protein CMG69_05080, partial [Candidatus Marinimicrobia bacterium]|nr:hypothetical protein [Candidatus Neomarinimicrobiota bacterium]